MAEHYRHFLPENTHPKQFMRPVTDRLRPEVRQLALQAESDINLQAAILFDRTARRRKGHQGNIQTRDLTQKPPGLRLGTELELLLFSEDSVPDKDKKGDSAHNPNYTDYHLQKVADVARTITDPHQGLGDILENRVDLGKIFMEIRTLRGSVSEYQAAMQSIADWISNVSSNLGIHPVIISQHFHFSLVDPERRINLLERREHRLPARTGLVDGYHRALPFVRLPEDVEDDFTQYAIGSKDGVKVKGKRRSYSNPFRLEGRVNSSEYAFDPDLNLFVNLAGLRRGLEHVGDVEGIDEDKPLPFVNVGRHDNAGFFVTGATTDTYEEALDRTMDDLVINKIFGSSLLVNLANAHFLYPLISAGDLSLERARNEMEAELDTVPASLPPVAYLQEVS